MKWLALFFLSGCLSAEQFDTDWLDAHCTLLSECEVLDLYGHSALDECLTDTPPLAEDCEDFDKEAAQDCLDRTEAMSCEAVLDNHTPTACKEVCGAAQ
jgi:hypothetical protein